MHADEDLPRAVSGQDAEALLGLVIELEAALIGDPAPEFVTRFSRPLRRAGLIGDGDGRPELRLALANLNQRLRYALGEYENGPEPDTGLVDHDIVLGSTHDALRFCDAIRELGMRCRHDDHGGPGPVRVVVTTTDLWLGPAFDAAQKHIEQVAVACGGSYNGFGGPGSPGAS